MTYSQTLGLIGYSLLPLVIVAPLVSLLKQYQWLAFFVKVTILHYRTSYIYIYIYTTSYIFLLLGCWCVMVDIQRWLTLGPGGTSTQEASSSLSHLSTLCLFFLPLHGSIAQFYHAAHHLVTSSPPNRIPLSLLKIFIHGLLM